MKIGLFGGSFDPPHRGHLTAALGFYDRCGLDRLFVLPAYALPRKPREGIDNSAMRLEMTSLCFGKEQVGDRQITVDDFELRQKGISYTVNTLRHFKERFPAATLHFLVGSDHFLRLDEWKEADAIFSLATPVLLRREDDFEIGEKIEKKQAEYREKFGKAGILLSLPCLAVSSGEIRGKLSRGESAAELLTPAVASYIAARGLYEPERMLALLREAIVPIEGEKRAAHSVAVEEEVRYYAGQFSLSVGDTLRLRIAALLHDLTHRFSIEEHAALLRRHGYSEETVAALLAYPKTVHQHTGGLLLRERFSYLQDEAILSAIGCHTTGKPGMSRLDMLLCLADYTEATRPYEECKRARDAFHAALENAATPEEKDAALTEAMLRYLSVTIRHVQTEGGELDPLTIGTREALLRKHPGL